MVDGAGDAVELTVLIGATGFLVDVVIAVDQPLLGILETLLDELGLVSPGASVAWCVAQELVGEGGKGGGGCGIQCVGDGQHGPDDAAIFRLGQVDCIFFVGWHVDMCC